MAFDLAFKNSKIPKINFLFSYFIEDGEQDLEDDNYLDPERDYDLINNLRRFIMTNNSSENQESSDDICVEDAHFQATSN